MYVLLFKKEVCFFRQQCFPLFAHLGVSTKCRALQLAGQSPAAIVYYFRGHHLLRRDASRIMHFSNPWESTEVPVTQGGICTGGNVGNVGLGAGLCPGLALETGQPLQAAVPWLVVEGNRCKLDGAGGGWCGCQAKGTSFKADPVISRHGGGSCPQGTFLSKSLAPSAQPSWSEHMCW